MDRTPFAGLTRLAPGEPLSTDGYSFQQNNPTVIDRLLEVGAVSHIHDAHAALGDPTDAPVATATTGGGGIAADESIYVTYTLLDAYGGETLPGPTTVVTTPPPIEPPDIGPTLALDTSAGNLLVNSYLYAISFTDGSGGETPIGPPSMIQRPAGPANAQILISGMAAMLTASGAAGWRLWRSVGGGSFGFLTAGSGDSFTDDAVVSPDCTMRPPTRNTTNGINILHVTVPDTQPADTVRFRVYLSRTGGFDSPSVAGTYLIAAAATPIDYPTLSLGPGRPPAVSQALPGAHKIDPATEIAGGPVTASKTAAALAAAAALETTIPLAKVFTIYRIQTNRPARVRLYASAAYQTADLSRPFSTAPSGDHGVWLDAETTSGDLDIAVAPPAAGTNFDASANAVLTITNLDSVTGDTIVTFTYLKQA